MKKTLVLICLCCSFLFGADNNPLAPVNFSEPQKTGTGNNNTDTTDLEQKKFFLNLNPNEIGQVQKREREVQEAFDGFTQKEINYKPVIRPIASMDTILLHPYFSFSLLLPRGSVISYVDSSLPMAVLKYDQNTLLIRPNSDFKIANITVFYNLKETNYVLNLLATRYEKSNDEKLNLVFSYSENPKVEPLAVMQTYIKENGDYPKDTYSYINIDGVSYRIVEDSKYGNLFVNGKKYRIDNNTIHK